MLLRAKSEQQFKFSLRSSMFTGLNLGRPCAACSCKAQRCSYVLPPTSVLTLWQGTTEYLTITDILENTQNHKHHGGFSCSAGSSVLEVAVKAITVVRTALPNSALLVLALRISFSDTLRRPRAMLSAAAART